MDTSTASRIIVRVSKAIASLSHQHIKMTKDLVAEQIKVDDIAIGVIYCTQIKIKNPGFVN